jgi:hypothetical protein
LHRRSFQFRLPQPAFTDKPPCDYVVW